MACLNQGQKGLKTELSLKGTQPKHPAGQISGPRRVPQSLTAAVVELSMVLNLSLVRTMDSSVECSLAHIPELSAIVSTHDQGLFHRDL